MSLARLRPKRRPSKSRILAEEACYAWVPSLLPNGSYTLTAWGWLFHNGGSWPAPAVSVTVTTASPTALRHSSRDKLSRCMPQASVPMNGGTMHPRETNENLDVPVTAWQYKGATFSFDLKYDSTGLVDPQSPAPPDFNGLSERNDKWSHPFAQWIDLWQDETGATQAVWHRHGCACAFTKTGSSFTAPDSYTTLTYGGGPITSPSFPFNGGTSTLSVDYGYFLLKDKEQTEYDFNYLPPTGQNHLYWQTAEATALPHYLLSRIRDRWGRTVTITWSAGTDGVPRVTSVRDGGNTGLTLNYVNNLLSSVSDAQGRLHTLSYAAYADENSVSRQKLASVTVSGPGSPYRTSATWSFSYADTGGVAYGGVYTGDLITQKTQPDGLAVSFRYAPVAWADFGPRPREEDWDGGVTRTSWMDSSEGSAVEKVITRQGLSETESQITFPGWDVSLKYTYTGADLTMVTDLSTQRQWRYTYDAKHNLRTTSTPLEPSGTTPLEQNDYYTDGAGHIFQIVHYVRRDDGSLGDPVETQYNAFNLPTQVKRYARAGSGNADQITQLQYGGGGALTVGSLTKLIEGYGTALQQETNTYYDAPDGTWGLPTRVVSPVGATTSFDYHDERGWLLSESSPLNLVVPTTHPDYPSSVKTTAYNGDGLPSLLTDALGHQVSVTYSAASYNSPNLVTTFTFGDGSYRQVTIDALGRTLQTRDERGILTQWTYTPEGKVKTIRRAAGTADEALTTYHYDERSDLSAIDPPGGSNGRVTFEYLRYNQDGSVPYPDPYEGQVTRINYADGSAELFGYTEAGELAWRRKADGSVITFSRDAQHRVTTVNVPAGSGGPAFSVTTTFDEFGRVTSSTDNTGTTSRSYDVLNRLTSLTPPTPRKALTYSFTKDLTLQRWITDVTVAGIGTYTWRRDTKDRLSEIVNPFAQTFHQEFDKDGKKTLTVHPNGVREERTYTDRDWLAVKNREKLSQ